MHIKFSISYGKTKKKNQQSQKEYMASKVGSGGNSVNQTYLQISSPYVIVKRKTFATETLQNI